MLPPELRRVLPEATVAAWPRVAAVAPDGAYLAGGTALAIHLHHRVSRDLDVFVAGAFDTTAVRRRLEAAGTFDVTAHTGDTLNGYLDGAKVQFLQADAHRTLDAPQLVGGLPVAGVRDLMADKLKGVGDRGELRDYFDLIAIERAGTYRVEQGLVFYRHRYGVGADDVTLTHIVRSLGYLDDVPDDPGLPVARAEIGRYWQRRQPAIERNLQAATYTHGVAKPDAPPSASAPGVGAPTGAGRCGSTQTISGRPCKNHKGSCPHHR